MNASEDRIHHAYSIAKEQYAELGVDTDDALRRLRSISLSIHCWQGDDVCGFEGAGEEIGGGLAVTGNYPGRARTGDELRSDRGTPVRKSVHRGLLSCVTRSKRGETGSL